MSKRSYLVELASDEQTIVLSYDDSLERAQTGFADWLDLKATGNFKGNVTLVSGVFTADGQVKQRKVISSPEASGASNSLVGKLLGNLPVNMLQNKSKRFGHLTTK